MKKIVITTFSFFALIACNSGGNAGSKNTTVKNSSEDRTSHPDYQKGLELEAKSDCRTCHNISTALVGPTYEQIAEKYASNKSDTVVGYLAAKIIQGGSGVWGEDVMLPHPYFSQEDAETLARYVLLFKKD